MIIDNKTEEEVCNIPDKPDDFLEQGGRDVLKALGAMSDAEYKYYERLSDVDGCKFTAM